MEMKGDIFGYFGLQVKFFYFPKPDIMKKLY